MIDFHSTADALAFDRVAGCTRVVKVWQCMVLDRYGREVPHVRWVDTEKECVGVLAGTEQVFDVYFGGYITRPVLEWKRYPGLQVVVVPEVAARKERERYE